jgi:NAD(P)-dependent dehydrogenase (short-subunit alcohol dehydrogenase family)
MARRPALRAHGCAWVTGASSGIGEALTRELVRRGWQVAVSARSAEKLEALAHEFPGQVIAAPCDVGDREQVKAAAATARAEFGRIGLAISNAGVYLPFEGPGFDAGKFETTIRANLIGAANIAEAVLADFCERREGHIHFVASATGFGGMPTSSAYGASKAGLINMAECLKIEMERHGVGVSLSTPGFVETPAQDENTFPKPFMIQPNEAARRIADAVELGGFETTFPRRFTWGLKALYALPKFVYLPLVRAQTGWNKPPE